MMWTHKKWLNYGFPVLESSEFHEKYFLLTRNKKKARETRIQQTRDLTDFKAFRQRN